MKRITVAKTAGFCFGVRRAVDAAFAEARSGTPACTLGELIHNPRIVEELARAGVRVIESPAENTDGRTVIIRSHGVPPQVYEELAASGARVVDATCPYVEKLHRLAAEHSGESVTLIAGDPSHPEVVGIAGFCEGETHIFRSAEELDKIIPILDNGGNRPVTLLAQTTFSVPEWEKCVEKLKKVCTKLRIFDTICIATEKRQSEARELAAQSDAMIVIGGRKSSNTAKLAQLCGAYCDTFLIESAAELHDLDLGGYTRIGVTAGASTPACIIKEVHKTMSEILKDQDELSFEEMLNESFKTIDNREKVTATVTGIAPNEISVDIGTKHAGYVPLSELTDDPNAKPEELVKVGDQMDLLVVRVNDVEGTVMLSKKRLDAIAGFEKVMNAVDTEEILEGKWSTGSIIDVDAVDGELVFTQGSGVVPEPRKRDSIARDAELLLTNYDLGHAGVRGGGSMSGGAAD